MGCVSTAGPVGEVTGVRAMTSVGTSSSRLTFERRHGGVTGDESIRRLTRIVDRLTDGGWESLTVRVAVLRSEEPNAYVLASGHMYVTMGMMDTACTDAELAAVLAHELAHLDDLRAFDRKGLSLSDRLEVEVAADERAVFLLVLGRYEPAALAEMILRLSDQQPDGWAKHRYDRLESYLVSTGHVEGRAEYVTDDASAEACTVEISSK